MVSNSVKSVTQSAASRKEGKANPEIMEQNSSTKKRCANKAMPRKTRSDLLVDTGSTIVSVTISCFCLLMSQKNQAVSKSWLQ